MKKTFYIESLGCAKNQVDSEDIIAQLQNAGWSFCDNEEEASVIVVNTCGFIESARNEAIETLLSFRASYPNKKIICAGCLSQRYIDSLPKSLPEIDGFLGNRHLVNIASQLEDIVFFNSKIGNLSFGEKIESPACCSNSLRRRRLNAAGFAYVKIAEGCNHNCSYCAIPLIRGNINCRESGDIVREVEFLVDDGCKEIILVAQDLFAYCDKNGTNLIGLLKQIFAIKKDFFVRLLYMHPDNFDFELLKLMKEEARLLPYLDIPFQHCNKNILFCMNRKGDFETYLNLISKIRDSVPNITIRSTFMLGHPSESSKTLKELHNFVERAKLNWVGFFVYSREEGTKSASATNAIKHFFTTKKAAKFLPKISATQQAISSTWLQSHEGEEVDLIIEEIVEGEPLALARAYFTAPDVDGIVVLHGEKFTVGEVVRGKITKINGLDCEAVLA